MLAVDEVAHAGRQASQLRRRQRDAALLQSVQNTGGQHAGVAFQVLEQSERRDQFGFGLDERLASLDAGAQRHDRREGFNTMRKDNAIEPGPQADQVFCGAFHAAILAGAGSGRKRERKVGIQKRKIDPQVDDGLQDSEILDKL
ncbi:MAG TPA: hypothetical protein VFK72_00025 [Nevskia sp.]|nr:hypothetical protein [Nevskia sp.]